MSSDYILTLEAIDRRLYSKDKSRPLARFSASDLPVPRENHTKDGLSEECLIYMTELLTRHGRPNLQMNHFLFLHFGGWDALMEYIQADPKRRSFLLRCEEKGYSVASERAMLDRMLTDGDPEKGEVSPSAVMRCILEANILIVQKYCGVYSGKSRQDLRDEIEGFLRNDPEEEKKLVPQMNPSDRYAVFRHIRSLLDSYEEYESRGEEESAGRALGTALAWLMLAALLRDSCRCLCGLLPQNIQILQVEERESRLTGLPAIASVSQPPRTGRIFKGRQKELEWIGEQFRHRQGPVWITGDGGCGKTSLALQYASLAADIGCVYAPFHEDLFNTIAEVRFQDRLCWEEISPDELFEFHLSRITRFGSRLLLIIDNFDADQYDRTFFEMLGAVCAADPEQRTNGDILDLLCRTGANILFTTRLFVPPQYPSVCLSVEEHLLSRAELRELAEEIYDDCEWTEAEQVMMEEIILCVGKHVMVVELIAAALKYNAGFSTIEEVLGKVRGGRYSQIGAGALVGDRGAPDVYSQMTRLFSFSAFSKEQQRLLRILSLLPGSGLDRGLFMELCEGTYRQEILRAMLLRFRDLHLAAVGKTISMHPVTADLAADKLLPDAGNCGEFIGRALDYYVPYTEKKYDYRLLAQISRLLMRIYYRLRDWETARAEVPDRNVPTRTDSPYKKEQNPTPRQVRGKNSFGAERKTDETASCSGYEEKALLAEMKTAAPAACPAYMEKAYAAWKASMIEFEIGHPHSALQWAQTARTAIEKLSDLPNPRPTVHSEFEYMSSALSDSEHRSAVRKEKENYSLPAVSTPSLTAFSAAVYKAAAQAEGALGRFEDALLHYRRAIELQESLEGGGIPEIAITYNDLAVVLYEMEEFEDAQELLDKALNIQTESYGSDSPHLSTTYNNLGLLSSARGDHALAVSYYEKSLALQRKCFGEMHPGTAIICCNLGQEYSELSETEKAEQYFEHALAINTDLFGEAYAGNAGICNNTGLMYDELARRASDEDLAEEADELMNVAFRWYWKALSILERNYGTENPHRADLYNNLACAYLFRGDTKNGYECFETALAVLEKIFGPDHPRTQALREDYAAAREWFDKKS